MKILFIANNDVGLYKFRKELIKELLRKHVVLICLPYGKYVDELIDQGCKFIPCDVLERRGTNPIKEIRLFAWYRSILKKYEPDIVFTYTIKPNVYGGAACANLNITYVANITGLGTEVEN